MLSIIFLIYCLLIFDVKLMWEDILKKPITISTTKIGLKPLPDNEEDDCNKKLKEYADKLKNMKFVYGDKKYEETYTTNYMKHLYASNLYWGGKKGFPIETIEFFYTPIPEEVACKALEIMNGRNRTEDTVEIMDYHISWYKGKGIVHLEIKHTSDWENSISLSHIVEDLTKADWGHDANKEDYTEFFDAYKNANIDWR